MPRSFAVHTRPPRSGTATFATLRQLPWTGHPFPTDIHRFTMFTGGGPASGPYRILSRAGTDDHRPGSPPVKDPPEEPSCRSR